MPRLFARCTHCRQKLALKTPDLAGKKVRCPGCGEPFVVRVLKPRAPAQGAATKPAAEEILEADVVAEPAAAASPDDDWLSALDELPPVSPVGAASTGATPPRMDKAARRKKRKPTGGGKRRRRRFPDGELPIHVHWMLMIVTGLGGGLVGTLLWAGFIWRLETMSGYMAILVGVCVGTGVRLGASKWDYGWGPALCASLIAFLSLVIGKIIGVMMLIGSVGHEIVEYQQEYAAYVTHENYQVQIIADEIMTEAWEQGREFPEPDDLDWSEDDSLDPETVSRLYPDEVWSQAEQRWQALPAAEREQRLAETRAEAQAILDDAAEFDEAFEGRSLALQADMPEMFHPLEIVFFILAIAAAFRIAAGWVDDEE